MTAPSRAVRLLRSPALRLTLLALVLVGGTVAFALSGGFGEDGVTRLVEEAGVAGPVVFVVLYTLLTVLLFPGSVLTLAAGVLFGVAAGTALTVVGATIGATLAFLVARRLGRAQVEQVAGRRAVALDRWLAGHGISAVLLLRLVPLVPFNLLNYAAGVTGVRLRDYVLGTFVGIIPGTFAYAALGGTLNNPRSPEFLGAVALVVVLAVVTPFAERRLRARGALPPAAPAAPEDSVREDSDGDTPGAAAGPGEGSTGAAARKDAGSAVPDP